MTAQKRPYVRVYYEIFRDKKFERVLADKACLGWWLTLLVAADAMFPEPATLPRKISDEYVSLLAEVELIDLRPNDCYLVHGLATERNKQSEQGRKGAEITNQKLGRGTREGREGDRDGDAVATHSSPLREERDKSLHRKAGLQAMSEVIPAVAKRLRLPNGT